MTDLLELRPSLAVEVARAHLEIVGGLVGTVDLRTTLGLSKQSVSRIVREPGFPEPAAHVDGRPVWFGEDVARWIEQRDQG